MQAPFDPEAPLILDKQKYLDAAKNCKAGEIGVMDVGCEHKCGVMWSAQCKVQSVRCSVLSVKYRL